MIIYIAGPLFTFAERTWNAQLSTHLRSTGYTVILPQEGAETMLSGNELFSAAKLFAHAVKGIEECDVVVAILDGPDPDSGTCWECGYAWKAGRPIIGVRTDLRPGGDDPKKPVNLMLSQSCEAFINATPSDIGEGRLAALIDGVLRTTRSAW